MTVVLSPPTPGPSLLKPKAAADSLAISERSLWALTQAGQIAAVRIGRSVRYAPDALADFVAKQTDGKRKK